MTTVLKFQRVVGIHDRPNHLYIRPGFVQAIEGCGKDQTLIFDYAGQSWMVLGNAEEIVEFIWGTVISDEADIRRCPPVPNKRKKVTTRKARKIK